MQSHNSAQNVYVMMILWKRDCNSGGEAAAAKTTKEAHDRRKYEKRATKKSFCACEWTTRIIIIFPFVTYIKATNVRRAHNFGIRFGFNFVPHNHDNIATATVTEYTGEE